MLTKEDVLAWGPLGPMSLDPKRVLDLLAEVERLTRELDEARTGAESWSREAKERQRALEVSIEERASALAERNEARECEESERIARLAAEANNWVLRKALETIERTGAPGATIVAQRSDEHSCSWCRGMVTPCPVVTARAALAQSADDSALRALVTRACEAQREACARHADSEAEHWLGLEKEDRLPSDAWQHRQMGRTAQGVAKLIRSGFLVVDDVLGKAGE